MKRRRKKRVNSGVNWAGKHALLSCPYDESDSVGDPLVEKFARSRKTKQATRVLEMLSQLERSRRG